MHGTVRNPTKKLKVRFIAYSLRTLGRMNLEGLLPVFKEIYVFGDVESSCFAQYLRTRKC